MQIPAAAAQTLYGWEAACDVLRTSILPNRILECDHPDKRTPESKSHGLGWMSPNVTPCFKVWSSWNIRGCKARIFPWARDCSSFWCLIWHVLFLFSCVISRRFQIPGNRGHMRSQHHQQAVSPCPPRLQLALLHVESEKIVVGTAPQQVVGIGDICSPRSKRSPAFAIPVPVQLCCRLAEDFIMNLLCTVPKCHELRWTGTIPCPG